jgi:hypothetical protein
MSVLSNRFDECRGDFARLSVRTDHHAAAAGGLSPFALALGSSFASRPEVDTNWAGRTAGSNGLAMDIESPSQDG